MSDNVTYIIFVSFNEKKIEISSIKFGIKIEAIEREIYFLRKKFQVFLVNY